MTPAIYDVRLTHVRAERAVRTFGTRLHIWLVDLDELPDPPWWLRPFAGFRAADHLGRPDRGLRRNLEEWLADKGIDVTGDRILMLAMPRVLGYAFNPLTVFWCLTADGTPRCVVAEVHNTYRERHPYLFRDRPSATPRPAHRPTSRGTTTCPTTCSPRSSTRR